MLDLNHPQTPYTFAASTQLGIILEQCELMTLWDARRRQFCMANVRPALAALRWLAHEWFADSPRLPDALADLECRVEQLAGLLPHGSREWGGRASECPVCGATATGPSEYNSISYCSPCMDLITPAKMRVESCEEGFRIEAI